jgi:gliding motility-associated-like protein
MSDSSVAIFGYKWYFGDNSVSTDINPIKSYTRPGTYQVKLVVTTINGCTDSVSNSVVVDTIPVASVASSQGLIICEGSSLVLNATGGTTYEWYKDGSIVSGITGNSFNANSVGTYTVRAISSLGCISPMSNSLTLTLLNKPKPDFDFDSYCINKPVLFTNKSLVSNSGPVNYQWSDTRGNVSISSNPVFTYPTSGIVTMKLKVTPQVCTSLADSITKTINIEVPRPGIRMPLIDGVKGDPIPLQARTFGTAYQWSPTTGLDNPLKQNPIAVLNAEQQYQIRIGVQSGCETVDTLLVRIFDNFTIFVPNVFTPNGDGQNDKLNLNMIGVKQLVFFRIFNKAGVKVFETRDGSQGWDGTVNGSLQPMDSYMWVVEAIDKYGAPIRLRGLSTLIR